MSKRVFSAMLNEQLKPFFVETKNAFHVLEAVYGYQQPEEKKEHAEDLRDLEAQVRYAGSQVGVAIVWTIAAASVDVVFVELQQARVFPSAVSFFPRRDLPARAKAINLYSLADLLGHRDDPDFLLTEIDYQSTKTMITTSQRNSELIKTQMPEVLAGLARAMQTYAVPLLQGDTRVISQVMKFHLAKYQRLFPQRPLPSFVVDDPS